MFSNLCSPQLLEGPFISAISFLVVHFSILANDDSVLFSYELSMKYWIRYFDLFAVSYWLNPTPLYVLNRRLRLLCYSAVQDGEQCLLSKGSVCLESKVEVIMLLSYTTRRAIFALKGINYKYFYYCSFLAQLSFETSVLSSSHFCYFI